MRPTVVVGRRTSRARTRTTVSAACGPTRALTVYSPACGGTKVPAWSTMAVAGVMDQAGARRRAPGGWQLAERAARGVARIEFQVQHVTGPHLGLPRRHLDRAQRV